MKLKFFLFIIFIQINIFATTLLTYNTYDRDDRIDLMLSFDTPYSGKIYLKKEKDNFIITLNNINFNKIITKNINSKIVEEIKIMPIKRNIEVILKSKKNIGIVASKTTDGFGLRIRAKLLQVTKINNNTPLLHNKNFKTNLNMDTNNYGESRYYIVLIILAILVLILLFVKKKASNQTMGNWLFKGGAKNIDIKILYTKAIDSKNSVVVLEYQNRKYLILTGSSNQLLDKFATDGTVEESQEEDFEKIFAKNREKLDDFLKVGNDKLSNYRDKAGLDITDSKQE